MRLCVSLCHGATDGHWAHKTSEGPCDPMAPLAKKAKLEHDVPAEAHDAPSPSDTPLELSPDGSSEDASIFSGGKRPRQPMTLQEIKADQAA